MLSMLGPPLLAPAPVAALAPEALTVALSCAGLAIVIAGKITLGRSFALMPANRGVVSTGLYRIVRHPIYMGYLVTHVAFLRRARRSGTSRRWSSPTRALLARAVCEEQTLARDPAYRDYQTRCAGVWCRGCSEPRRSPALKLSSQPIQITRGRFAALRSWRRGVPADRR